jgi:hypothetical protein
MAALSILLIAIGAILRFAVTTEVDNVDLGTIGMILMVVGAIGLVVAVIRGSWMGFSTTHERRVSPDGRTVIEHDRTSGF